METLQETRRQIRITLIVIALILLVGIIGFMLIEGLSLLDSVWLTVITLATVGYGDVYARSDGGRLFTVLLIAFGIGTVAYGLQATATLLLSPVLREARQRRVIDRRVNRLGGHYILCGSGEMVEHTIRYVLDARMEQRKAGRDTRDTRGWLLRNLVVVTADHAFADHLRENAVLVLDGDPTADETLIRAGIHHARAIMVLIDSDSESVLTVLAARALNSSIDISVTIHDDDLARRVTTVGANAVISPYELAGQFLNLATLRPIVNDFFHSILFNLQTGQHTIALAVQDHTNWAGQRVEQIRTTQQATVLAMRQQDGRFLYAPQPEYVLQASDTLVVVVPESRLPHLAGNGNQLQRKDWHLLPMPPAPIPAGRRQYTADETEAAIAGMHNHFVVICAGGETARHAISKLNPERPFVVICSHVDYAQELIERGFKVVIGDPQREPVLRQAGIERALAAMVALDNDSECVVTVLLCQTLNERLRITATAHRDDLFPRLRRAGADEVVGPLQTAARFLLLATIRPVVSDFLQHVVYNYNEGIETTELLIKPGSQWVGKPLSDLRLRDVYQATVVGVRRADGVFDYVPADDYTISAGEVLIVITPMQHADMLRRLVN
jgi:voltage-gated potassium channel